MMEEETGRRVVVVGICGASGSGKTTLAKALDTELNTIKEFPFLVHLDDFFREDDPSDGWQPPPTEIPGRPNREGPEALNFGKLASRIRETKEKIKALPIQDNNNISYLFVEGFLLFCDEDVVSLLDKKIFIKADRETCLERRRGRTERTPSEEEYFLQYFDRYIWANYEKHNSDDRINSLSNLLIVAAEMSTQDQLQQAKVFIT